MRHYIYKVYALILAFTVTSCESYLINGDLDGFWQLQTVEHLNSGEITHHNNDAFYAFQRHIIQLTRQTESHVMGQMGTRYHAEFCWQNDSIEIGEFREYDLSGCKKKVPSAVLEQFGIFQENTIFYVENLDKKSLILTSEDARIVLRKY